MMSCNRLLLILLIPGVLIFIVGVVGFVILPMIIVTQVEKTVVIQNGSDTYDQFLMPTVPILMQIYVFHLVNSLEVLEGEKPVVEERGPYTYREHRFKYDLDWTPMNTVVYKQNKTFVFEPTLSVGFDNDTFVTGNVPFMTLINGMQYQPSFIRNVLSLILSALPKETLFIRRTVREIVWGYHDSFLAQAKKLIPSLVNTDFIGILTGVNASYDGVYEVHTGVSNISRIGSLVSFNGTNLLDYWTSQYANSIVGTDGTLVPPFLKKTSRLHFFVSDICRSVYSDFSEERSFSRDTSVPVWRFTGPNDIFQNASVNPDNAGFCTPTMDNCLPTGLLNLTVCKSVDQFQLPIVVSQPHFLGADPDFIKSIRGMHPDAVQHQTYIDIEPTTGIVMEAMKRMQVNLYIKKTSGFVQFENVKDLYLPILWLNESAILDDANLNMLKTKLFTPRYIANSCLIGALSLGSILLLASFLLFAASCLIYPNNTRSLLVNDTPDATINTDSEHLISDS